MNLDILKDALNPDLQVREQMNRLGQIGRAAIVALAFSGSRQEVELIDGEKVEVRKALEALLAEAPPGTSYRAFILEALSLHSTIARIGVACYYENKQEQNLSQECKARWAQSKLKTLPLETPESQREVR